MADQLDATVRAVTQRIIDRSRATRADYLRLVASQIDKGRARAKLSCGNLAHTFAAAGEDKDSIRAGSRLNVGIVTSYNDMLSAHQPYGRYPDQIKLFAREVQMTAQVAGGVPAMCDGITQGQDGMELSLFSRDVIALSTAVSLSHHTFDAVLLLGICDKIVPGLLMGALRFGHLPTLFVPSGPMPTGLGNKEKTEVRKLYAQQKVGRDALLQAEAASYHSPGTCTFYGTANSNQMLLEVMGLHVPGAAFVPPNTPLRQALTRAAVHRLRDISQPGDALRPLGHCVDEKAIVNAIVGLLATGGSTNHTLHIPAMAKAAGIIVDWSDMQELSAHVPLIAKIYPNGPKDINDFQKAGGTPFVIRELLDAGLLHADILAAGSQDFSDFGNTPQMERDALTWQAVTDASSDVDTLRPVAQPFKPDGGIRLLEGNLGRSVIKTSALQPSHLTVEAPVQIFSDQESVVAAFKAGALDRDVVVVVRYQGPRANGMPELHALTPALAVLQGKGFRVALVTDGRLSGASGAIPAAIHVTPEAARGGQIAKLRDGDIVRVCAQTGVLQVLVDDATLASREAAAPPADVSGCGREIFALFRHNVDGAEQGASPLLHTTP